MKNKAFEVSEFGNLLIYDRRYSAFDVKNIIEINRLNGLRIFDIWNPLPSLDFLRDYTFLTSLEITCDDDHDFSFLSALPQLRHFSLGPSHPMKNQVDLSAQQNLRSLALQWRTNKISGLERCQQVDDLCLIEFPKTDLSMISGLWKIKRLRIKTGSIKSLEGIENLTELENLEVGNCRTLRSISQLNGLRELKRIRLESCKNIEDLEKLFDLHNLSVLEFVNCGEIPDIDFATRFPKVGMPALLGQTKLKKS